jgi:hypothetical protein
VTITSSLQSSSAGPRGFTVKMLSGQEIIVQGTAERDFYNEQQKKYTTENTFSAVSDLQDLDRMLFMELLVYRATCWLASGKNYYKEILGPGEEADCRKVIKENSPLISTIKNDLGLTKAQREKDAFTSVGSYIVNLKARAREHGIHREKQVHKALSLINQLFSMVGAYDRSDEVERFKLGLEKPDDILDWVREVMRPEFDAIDTAWRQNQRAWLREL